MFKLPKRIIRQLLRCRQGAVTVEFSITIIFFIFMVLYVAETARLVMTPTY